MQLYSLQQKDEYCLSGKLGLKNYGTSSFLNAVIQAISNIEPLCFILRELPYELVNYIGISDSEEGRLKRTELYYVLRKVLRELWKDKRIVIEPAVLIRRMNALNFLYDAIASQNLQETLSCLLEVLHDTLLQQLPPQFEPQVNLRDTSPMWDTSEPYHRSPVSEIFQGILEITSECTQCHTQIHSLEPFFLLNLSIVNLSKSATELSKIHAAGVRRETDNRSKKIDRTFTSGSNKDTSAGWIVRSISRKETFSEESPAKKLGRKLSRRFSISFDDELNSDDEISEAKAVLPAHAEEKSTSDRESNGEHSEKNVASKQPFAESAQSMSTVFQHLQQSISDSPPQTTSADDAVSSTPKMQKKASSEILGEATPMVPVVLRPGKSAPRLSYYRERRHTSMRIVYDSTAPSTLPLSDDELPAAAQRHKAKISARALNTYDYVKYSNKTWCERSKDYWIHALYQLGGAVGMHLIGVGCHVHETLLDYFKTENKSTFCDVCQQHTKTTYSKSLSAAPEVLCLNYKRFINLGFFNSKINALVDFPLEKLDISDYMTQASGYFRSAWKQYPLYDLSVLIYHKGESNAKDNYIVIAKHMPENVWFEYADQRVREVTESYVKSREAMMLFYTRRANVGPKAAIDRTTLRHSLLYHVNKHKTEVEYAMNARKKKEEEIRKQKEKMHRELLERQKAGDGRMLRGRLSGSMSFRKLSTSIRRLSNGVNAFRKNSQSDKTLKGLLPPDNPPSPSGQPSVGCEPKLPNILPLVIDSDESSSMKPTSPSARSPSKINTPSNVVLESLQSTGKTNEEVRDASGLDSPRPETDTKVAPATQQELSPIDTHLTPLRMVRRTILKMTAATKPVPVQPDKVIFTSDLDTSLLSTYWCMKYLSMEDPGPICNHDIVCCHGYLKPYLSECTSRIYTPVNNDLLREISTYLNIKYSYPLWSESDPHLVRTIKDLRMCVICSHKHDDLMERRFEEAKGVSMAFLRDGNEPSLSEDEQRQIQRDLLRDRKYYSITNDISTRNLADSGTDNTSRDDDQDPILGSSKGAPYCCIIFNKWVELWKKFVRAGLVAEDVDYPVPPPGPICNRKLLDDSGAVRPSLLIDVDYIAVSPGVWEYLHGIYGGGPAIFREDIDIYSEPANVPSGSSAYRM